MRRHVCVSECLPVCQHVDQKHQTVLQKYVFYTFQKKAYELKVAKAASSNFPLPCSSSSPTPQCTQRLHAPIFACWVLLAQLSVPLFLWMNDPANVLGLLAQSSALSVPATVVLILLSPAWPVATDVHANALPPVLAAPSCPAPPGRPGQRHRRQRERTILRISTPKLFLFSPCKVSRV